MFGGRLPRSRAKCGCRRRWPRRSPGPSRSTWSARVFGGHVHARASLTGFGLAPAFQVAESDTGRRGKSPRPRARAKCAIQLGDAFQREIHHRIPRAGLDDRLRARSAAPFDTACGRSLPAARGRSASSRSAARPPARQQQGIAQFAGKITVRACSLPMSPPICGIDEAGRRAQIARFRARRRPRSRGTAAPSHRRLH